MIPGEDQDDPIVTLSVATDWGPVALGAGADGVYGIGVLATEAELARSVRRRVRRPVVAIDEAPTATARMARRAAREIERYAAGGSGERFGPWQVPIRLVGLSDWDQRVLTAVRDIPWGTTASYGEIARAAGSPGAARAAGGAVGRNPIGLIVPCHRVIAGDGTIGGYGGSWPADRDALIALKRALLAHEGVVRPNL